MRPGNEGSFLVLPTRTQTFVCPWVLTDNATPSLPNPYQIFIGFAVKSKNRIFMQDKDINDLIDLIVR
jgi:hypothetical protein